MPLSSTKSKSKSRFITKTNSSQNPNLFPSKPNLFFFFLLFFLLLLHLPSTTSKTAFCTCSESLPSNPTYQTHLTTFLSTLPDLTSPTLFSNLTTGTPPNTIHSLALCRGDLTPSQCHTCLTTATSDVLLQCPSSRSAAVWYDRCRLRFSDIPFFGTLTPDVADPYYYSINRTSDLVVFRDGFIDLVRVLRRRVVEDERRFAAGKVGIGEGWLYGVAMCGWDLSGELCGRCLDGPIGEVVCCIDSVDVTFHGGSCYLRYSFQDFYNQTRVEAVRAGLGGDGDGGGKGKSKAAIVFAVLGAVLLVLAIGFIIIRARKKKKPRHLTLGGRNLQMSDGSGLKFQRLTSHKVMFFNNPRSLETPTNDALVLDLQTINIATENLSDKRRLGRGEFGPVYKGDIHGREFVVKKLTGHSTLGLEDLRKEFKNLKQLQHPNIARLLAYHLEEEKMMVYEYLPNTSLDRILFDPKKRVLLDWGRRYKIIEGIARGLNYLHEESGLNIVHQNLKASNVLLDKNMTPKLSDFCLAKLFIGSQSQGNTKRTATAQGYVDSAIDGRPSAKADIFGYGVLVLEIITGQRNRDFLGSDNNTNLLNYVWQYWKDEKALQVLDWSLGELYKGPEVLRCIHVALLCVQSDVERRPNMSTVVHMLSSYSFTLPTPSMPSATRVRRPTNSDGPPRNGGSGNWDPSNWSDVPLDATRGKHQR